MVEFAGTITEFGALSGADDVNVTVSGPLDARFTCTVGIAG
jgi:hypothetical protein